MSFGIAVIGAGMMGAQHAENLSEIQGVHLPCVCDASAATAADVAARVGANRHTTDPHSVVQDASVDAIVVASPDDTHADLVLAALEVGKPVLCEKPLAGSAKECRSIIDAEIKGGRRLVTVGFMRRFDPHYLDLKSMLSATTRSEDIMMMHCSHRNATCPEWFTAELGLSNAVVHEIDIARWLLKEEIETVQVMSRKKVPGSGFDDPQFVVMRTTSGTLVNVEIFMQSRYGYEINAEVVCSDQVIALSRPVYSRIKSSGAERSPITDDWRLRFKNAYKDEITAWAVAVAEGNHVGASAWDGLRAALVTDACLESKMTGREIVVPQMEFPTFYDERSGRGTK
ncbi:MAG: Gfo/Idh/MocA family oxidoreductase [Stappiaceae bacterium]